MLARIMCLIIVILEARGLFLSIGGRRWKVFAFYTQLANIATAVSAVLVLAFGETPFTILLRYLSSCMLMMTFFVTSCILIPMGGDPKLLLLSGNGLYHHLIIPIVSAGSYLLIERHVQSATAILFPTVLTFLYGMIMLWVNYKDIFDGPYPFFRVKNQSVKATVLWMSALTAVIALIALGLLLLGQ
ncbi:MAG: hypothetical protein IJ179_08990 [Oscillospiraceae bacterium]|nr:hypothetical protein [Oscillospiraceae bacterium]